MCVPAAAVPLIQAGFAAASTVMAYQGQQRAASAQAEAANSAHNASMMQLEEQRRQVNMQTSQEMSERGRQALMERGRLRAAAAEGGVGGNSISRIFGANEFNYGQDLAMMQVNNRNVMRQSAAEASGIAAQTQSRLNSIERPSLLNAGLQIAGIGMEGYSKYKKIT